MNDILFFYFSSTVLIFVSTFVNLKRSEFDNCNLLRNFVLITTTAKNPTS